MESVIAIDPQRHSKDHQLRQPWWQRAILLIILGYEGAGGILGGILLIVAPDGHLMDMPVSMMRGAFPDFLMPGILLLGMGILNVTAFISLLRRRPKDWLIAALAMGGYWIWFMAEIIILNELHWLHLMWGLPVLLGWIVTIPLIALRHDTISMKKMLLSFGILSSLWYVVINIYVPFFYPGYSVMNMTVSELSAINTPTRIMWVLSCTLYLLLFTAFGWGVLKSTKGNRPLQLVGLLIIIYCLLNIYWPPMHIRGTEKSLSDALHITWAVITVMLMLAMTGIGAYSFGTTFRIYSWITIGVLFIFGSLTGMLSGNVAAGRPTPMIGIWERINIGVFMIWVIILANNIKKNISPPPRLS